MSSWILTANKYCEETHLHDVPVYTLGNGLIGCRGFFEEQQQGIAALGGIYMARVFGASPYIPWAGIGRDLANVPNFFSAVITINKKPLEINEKTLKDFTVQLDIQNGTLTRTYTYWNEKPLARFTFTRFISNADIFTCGQTISVTPLTDDACVEIICGINTDITNLNEVSCEPWPIQPGRRHCECISRDADTVIAQIAKPDKTLLAFGQETWCDTLPCEKIPAGHRYVIAKKNGETHTIKKLIHLSLSPDDGENVQQVLSQRMAKSTGYENAYNAHVAAMHTRWRDADITIKGNEGDQLSLRYNILQLMQAAPEHTENASIGARGLTGEMYEGSIFWDTEIFMVPFFTFTRPQTARKLLRHRCHTLPEARKHAESNWLRGAMYGWQVNALGQEQTPQGVGAYYSIHVISDIAYAMLEYWYATADKEFMLQGGLEVLIETSRFWESRVQLREDGKYDIMAVRGPNEYDVLVNNNLYTNMMARENMRLCLWMLEQLSKTDAQAVASIKARLNFEEAEPSVWTNIANNIILPYDEKQDLWLEDDAYLRRRPLDMQKAKPTGKRIIDTTIPYEALPLYQVTKQADVLHAMKNLPWCFTQQQMHTAYDFYEPRTAFDSSLSYSMFALMAARLQRMDTAADYFDRTANLDIRNVQLNTISGLHFANFGGTWQVAVMGFGGVSVHADSLKLTPHLPSGWQAMEFTIYYLGARLNVQIDKAGTRVTATTENGTINGEINIEINGESFTLSEENKAAFAEVK